MEFRYIDQSLQAEWENLTKSNPASGFKQSFFWADFNNILKWTIFKIGVFDKSKLTGGAIVMKSPDHNGKNYLYIPEGPVIPYDKPQAEKMFHNLIGEIDRVANLKGKTVTTHLQIGPRLLQVPLFFSRFRKSPHSILFENTILLDLRQSDDQILQQMKPKCRYNIKVAQKHGIEVIAKNPPDGVSDFMTLYEQTITRNKFEGKNEDYFAYLIPLLIKPQQSKLFLAKRGNTLLAAALIIMYGKKATFLFGASSDLHREKMAPYLLHWEIIRYAKHLGLQLYDFYGIAPDENDLSHPWHGITVFKKKFCQKQTDYIGDYDFVYNEKEYAKYLQEDEEAE